MTRRLMLLLAHPDDETFGPGGTVARYAREGVEITLVTATRGEEGMTGDPPVTEKVLLGEVREAELARAATILGIREIVFLGFRDKQLEHLPPERILEKAVEQVRRVRPQVLIGFGPEGVSRHPDHVVMSRVAFEAFDAAGDPARFPGQIGNGLPPYAPYKLYQFEIAREILDRWEVPLAGVPERELTTFIDTSGFVETKVRAFSAHKTQARDARRILSREGYRAFSRRETYVLARSRNCQLSFPEEDLFQGIPAEGDEGE